MQSCVGSIAMQTSYRVYVIRAEVYSIQIAGRRNGSAAFVLRISSRLTNVGTTDDRGLNVTSASRTESMRVR